MVTTLPGASSSKEDEARKDVPETSEEPPPPYESLDHAESHTDSHIVSPPPSRVDEQVASLLNEHLEHSDDPRADGLEANRDLSNANNTDQTVDHKYVEKDDVASSSRGGVEPQLQAPSFNDQHHQQSNPGYPQYPVPQGAPYAHSGNTAPPQEGGWASSVGNFFGSMGSAITQRHNEIQDRRQDRRDAREDRREERREARQNYRELRKEHRQERREARRESRH